MIRPERAGDCGRQRAGERGTEAVGVEVADAGMALHDPAVSPATFLAASLASEQAELMRVFPATALEEASSPALLPTVCELAAQHDLGDTIHLALS